jgi:8-oxo-dGTP diphosphatase
MGEFKVGVKSIIIYNKKSLLIKRVKDEGECWEFPGGVMEFGESLHEALRREIKEETGLENIHIKRFLYAMTVKVSPERQIVGLGYLSYANSDKVTLSPDEHTDFIWADKKQFINLLNKHMLHELIEHDVLDSLEFD